MHLPVVNFLQVIFSGEPANTRILQEGFNVMKLWKSARGNVMMAGWTWIQDYG